MFGLAWLVLTWLGWLSLASFAWLGLLGLFGFLGLAWLDLAWFAWLTLLDLACLASAWPGLPLGLARPFGKSNDNATTLRVVAAVVGKDKPG